ncbi:MAG: hypothetical protein JSU87_10940 [Gemmatimonadota bacterium]|nr:MAG: hypothetical protein JSU87_10940 [Gemmatimonadota bacterium]
MIEIATLGRISVRRAGQEIDAVAAQKQLVALLVYLALEGPVSRESLLPIFWPGRDRARARHSLSQALYALRRELGDECIRAESDTISVAGETCRVDAAALQTSAGAEDWQKVFELYEGPFLDQFTLPGAPEFEAWSSATASRLAVLAQHAFSETIDGLLQAGHRADALSAAWRWTQSMPLNDEAQRTLILQLAQAGDRGSAIEQYESYRAALAEKRRVEPLPETAALVAKIRAGEIPGSTREPFVPAMRPAGDDVSEPSVPAAAAAQMPWPPFVEELRRRRLFQVGAVYLGVAWLAIEFTSILVERAVLPDLAFPVVLFFLAVGLPFTVILAWAQEARSAAAGDRVIVFGRRWPKWAANVRVGQILIFLLVLAASLAAAWAVAAKRIPGFGGLDTARVVVYPLQVSPTADQPLGEDVSTLVGNYLESGGLLRFVDGWYGLDEVQRAGMQSISRQSARVTTRRMGAAYYIRGRIILFSDSVRVRLELHDVAGDSVVARGDASGARDGGWRERESERATRQLLTGFFGPGRQIDVSAATDTPLAYVQYREGERAYRRARFQEAYEHYGRAVEADSLFALAAIRGALAASWLPEDRRARYAKAQAFLDVALRRTEFLPPRRVHFAYGMREYIGGRADSAVAEFKRALAIAPESWDVWARLGEVYQHLLPSESPLDSLAEAAFLEARRNDPEFFPALFHLSEYALRRNDVRRAEELVRALRDADADSARLFEVSLMLDCVRNSPEMVDWRDAVLQRPNETWTALRALAVGAHQIDCARAGWQALLAHDTATDDWQFVRHFNAILALQSLLVAEGRFEELTDLLENDSSLVDYKADFYLLDALASAPLAARANEAAEVLQASYENGELRWAYLIWLLGAWYAHAGRLDAALPIADSLARRADRTAERLDRLLAQSLAARIALAGADTATALRLLKELVPTREPSSESYPWETLAYEQLALARLLYATGAHAEALDVASNLDAPARPPVDLMYLPASLELRLEIARAVDDRDLEDRCRARLMALGRQDLLDR